MRRLSQAHARAYEERYDKSLSEYTPVGCLRQDVCVKTDVAGSKRAA